MAAMTIYGKIFKNLILKNTSTDGNLLYANGYSVSRFTNGDVWLTFDFFMARSNMGKCWNMRFHGKY